MTKPRRGVVIPLVCLPAVVGGEDILLAAEAGDGDIRLSVVAGVLVPLSAVAADDEHVSASTGWWQRRPSVSSGCRWRRP